MLSVCWCLKSMCVWVCRGGLGPRGGSLPEEEPQNASLNFAAPSESMGERGFSG